ncbi:MAG: hypothetical protein NC231_09935 [Bacillus sp. (in: Bacteria)]|nr:hypothetical protein [Bacillus sp. (in: firmicutes)]MCM1427759.1 hypothetical protein [Eubacterium sp.]
MRKWKKLIFVMTAAFFLAGCGSVGVPDMNTISVMKDGKITQTIVDGFERNYYNPEELEQMAKEKIARYSDSEEAIVCESVESSGDKIIVKMVYQSGTEYTNYNNRELFCGTVGEAFEKGYSLKDIVGEDGEVISDEELSAIRENHVVIVQTKALEQLDVNVYDKILYTSENVMRPGKRDALIVTGEDEEILSCIVFQ